MTCAIISPKSQPIRRFLHSSKKRSCRHIVFASAEDLPSKIRSFVASGTNWKDFLSTLFLTGCVAGPLLDSIHSRTALQVYDSLPIDITSYGLDVHSSLWVPPILGAFYVVLGTLHPLTDFLAKESRPIPSWGTVALNYGVLAGGTEFSAWMYEHQWEYIYIHGTLACFAVLNWAFFDKTRQGFLLGCLCAIGAPLAELPIIAGLKWWHYSRPDFYGLLTSWVIWCYFFYTPAVGNLARKLWSRTS